MDDFFWKIKLKFRTLWGSPSGRLIIIGIGLLLAGALLAVPSAGGIIEFLKNALLVIAAWAGFLFGGFILAIIFGGVAYGLVRILGFLHGPFGYLLMGIGAVLVIYGFLRRRGIIRPRYKYKEVKPVNEVKPKPVIRQEWKDFEGTEPLFTFAIDNVYSYSEYEVLRHIEVGTEVKVRHLNGNDYEMTADGRKICDSFTHIHLKDQMTSSSVLFVTDKDIHFDEDTGPVCVLTIGIF
ncbi:MAG: hypothetical protein IIZ33_03900 [Erysipelotrichaceae bacterium]|nr:hypothetical protein [Erysipelotrichaceae bacterium]